MYADVRIGVHTPETSLSSGSQEARWRVIIGVPKETYPGEQRVAMVPANVAILAKQSIEVIVERGAGELAGYTDQAFADKGAKLVSRDEVFEKADLVAMVRAAGANPNGDADIARLREGQVLVAFLDPLANPEGAAKIAARKVEAWGMELIPRTTRAQSMDALSSMANLAGYKAVLLAANHAPRILPMMTTAAGTVTPAKVLVLGVGVAGLQAIATAKRLGASVEAYDIRPEVREQVQSVGGKFVDLGLDTSGTSDKGGYAKAQTDEFIAKQQAALAEFVRAADIVITTAQVPGRKAPTLLTAAMQKGMKPGSIVVDLAAETGGNCELTKAGETYVVDGVTMIGPVNLASTMAFHSSQLYSKNVTNLVQYLCTKEGAYAPKDEEEIVKETRVCRGGEVVHARVAAALEARKAGG